MVHAASAASVDVEPGADPQVIAEALIQWQAGYDQLLRQAAARQGDLSQLDAVLDNSSLDDLEIALSAAEEHIAALEAAAAAAKDASAQAVVDAELCAEAVPGVDGVAVGDVDFVKGHLAQAEEHLTLARAEELRLAKAAENAAGMAAERGRSLASVAEAEERKAAAAAELARVSELANTLEVTQSFLTAAQNQVHRSIAPVLTDTLRTWLPLVTNGRYTDATVNPATLEVKVCGPQRKWRPADRLSIGTAEQIYLLLRVALAQHLTTTPESCPLLLDDVTVQADPERTVEILDLLLALSADRQVIVFAQEPAVAAWAQANLADPRHTLTEMTRVTVE